MKKVLNYFLGYIKNVDKVLPVLCLALTAFDIFLINSMVKTGFVKEGTREQTQLIAAIIGIVAAAAISFVPYKLISKFWFVMAPAAIILQLLLFTSLGTSRDDDVAWLDLGFATIQPAEILKFVFIVTLATHISKLGDKLNSPKHLLPLLAHGLVPAGIIIIQGDAGSALVFVFIFLCMIFMAGLSWKYLLAAGIAVPAIIIFAWNNLMQPHHKLRFLILFDKELQQAEIRGKFYQQYNGTIVLGSGQLTGLGFDQEHYHSTPEIYNDYIFAYIGMTLGFIGCMAVVIVLAMTCLKLLSNASGAQNLLGKMMCTGVFAMIFFHTVINIGMALTVVPVIGIPLPFISTGGTSMIMTHACIGLVMSVTAHREKEKHMFY